MTCHLLISHLVLSHALPENLRPQRLRCAAGTNLPPMAARGGSAPATLRTDRGDLAAAGPYCARADAAAAEGPRRLHVRRRILGRAAAPPPGSRLPDPAQR